MNKNKTPPVKAVCTPGTTIKLGEIDTCLFDLAFEPIMIREFSGEISYWNRGAVELYGYGNSEAIGAVSHDLLKTVFSIPRQEFEDKLLDKGTWIGELIHTAKDGQKVIVESRHQLFELEDGKKLVLETNRDITVRETQYRSLFKGMQEGAGFCRMLYDVQGHPADWIYLDVNPALEKILGNFDMIGQRNSELFPGMNESNPELLAMLGRVAKTGMSDALEGYLNGPDIWVYLSAFSPARDHFIVLSKNISDRKQADIELRSIKARLEHLLTAGPAVIYACKPEGDFGATFISNNISRQLGYTPEDFVDHSGFWTEHIHPDDAARVFSELPKLFETGRHTLEYRFMHKNGTYRWMLDELRLVQDADGKPLEIIGAWHDITEIKFAEEELHKGEQSLRLSLDAARMGMWDWNLSTDALWWDEREHELFGIPVGEFSGFATQGFERMHPDDREEVKKAVMDAVSRRGLFEAEFRVIHPDGSIRWLAGRGQMVAAGANRMMGVNYDITGLKQAELERDKYTRMENLAQMHRLQIAGEFAALLAHRLNQPLTAIRSFAEAGIARLRRGKLDPIEMRETLNDVVAQSERAAGSIRDLRKFLARQPQEMMMGDINAEVNAACALMDVLAHGRKIKLRTDLAKDLPLVSMRSSQIEQIIVNLVENAMDAINHTVPNGGTIEIGTRLDENSGEIVISIQDSGPGLDDKTVGLVFDPLYTTKMNGIGMGLAISRSIIADHGGRIWAEPGPGGHFFFTLPVQK